MTEGQFAVIACALLTIALLVGPAWQAVFVFLVSLAAYVVSGWISRDVARWRRRR